MCNQERIPTIRRAIEELRPIVRQPERCQGTYDILVPIFNAYDEVLCCLKYLTRYTDPRHPIYLLDDCSSDKRVLPFLYRYARQYSNIRVLPSKRNRGFVSNVNRGLELSENSVVLLNSDTRVTPYWLERMDRCLRSDEHIGIVSPLSNFASILSVPEMNEFNDLPPPGMRLEEFSEMLAARSVAEYPRIPTSVGFCMLISRATIKQLGLFDVCFDPGYGEENDYCMRAWSSAIEVVCCDDALVYHSGRKSFSQKPNINSIRKSHSEILNAFWPDYNEKVHAFYSHNPLSGAQNRAKLIRSTDDKRSHLLHVIHNVSSLSGTQIQLRYELDAIQPWFRSTVLFPYRTGAPHKNTTTVDPVTRDTFHSADIFRFYIDKWQFPQSIMGFPVSLQHSDIEERFLKFLSAADPDIVHFHHLGTFGTLWLPLIAKLAGKKVILSLNDYFLLCPDYNLLGCDYQSCGKLFADPESKLCASCLDRKTENPLSLQMRLAVNWRAYLAERFELVNQILEIADALVAPSSYCQRRFEKAFGTIIKKKCQIIPCWTPPLRKSRRPERGPVFRVGWLGNATVQKGIDNFFAAARELAGRNIQFEVFGALANELVAVAKALNIQLNGRYDIRDLPKLLERVDVAAMLTRCDETFCNVVSEAQAMRVPVIATRKGAIREKIADGKTGFLVRESEFKDFSCLLKKLSSNRNSLRAVSRGLEKLPRRSLKEYAGQYEDLYKAFLSHKAKAKGYEFSRSQTVYSATRGV